LIQRFHILREVVDCLDAEAFRRRELRGKIPVCPRADDIDAALSRSRPTGISKRSCGLSSIPAHPLGLFHLFLLFQQRVETE